MAASGFTPISLYYSTTAAAVPTSGNLVAGELALNTVDEKLYFKNSAGTVKLLASNATTTPVTPAGSNTQIQFNNSGAFGASASLTWSGTVLATLGLTVTNDATISGLTVGRGSGAVSTNTAVGASALAANSSGIQTVAIGANAGQYQTNNNNTAVGFNSLVGVSGSSNGGSNTAVGSNSLAGLTSGNFNTGIGQQALVANTTASNNTAVGYQSLYRNTAANNTAFGFSAGYQITSGTSNTALGYYAMGSNGGGITGSSNTAVGNAALTSVSSGGSNVAIGGDALYGMTTASYSTAVGFQAGYSSVSADYNTFIGYYAGRSTTGDQNTFVGKFSGNAVTTGTLNTIIGAYNGNQGGLDIRTLSNYIVLSDGGGTPRFYSDTNGVVYDGNGKLRAVPQSGAAKSTSYTLATTDVGEFINVVSGGAIVIPNATFATGDVITIFNNNTSTMTITCSISTALIAGNSTDKATMTLAVAGVATILFINSTECVVSGNVT